MNGNSCFWSISHHLFLRMKFMREENYESDLQSHLEPGEALLCSGPGNRRQMREKQSDF